jgi:uncharacterized protein
MATDEQIRDQTLVLMSRYQELITTRRFDEWIELWTDDAVCEFPFAGPGRPARLTGKAEILAYMKAYPDTISVEGVQDIQLHPGQDPNVLVVELTIAGTATQTGRPYNQQFVIIARARDGRLAHYREYWNALVSAEAFAS